ncbi:alanine--tRNA ligase [Candidatus Saccharibacteria bacterium]|nr:alanine--tRNA ligase [Candidatus Saccharibacteria bacterium]
MNAQAIRRAYLDYCKQNKHTIIPRAKLVPDNDPTTLFTGSGMQPLLPYLLGEPHPAGSRVANSQTCFRADDIEEVGDNRHTTFFEMLGNWSFGDYFKEQQLPWFFAFLVDEIGLDPSKIFVTVFAGDKQFNLPADDQSAKIWQDLFNGKGIEAQTAIIGSEQDGYQRGVKMGERIFYYDGAKNWWSRGGKPATTPIGDPCGPDSEVFYLFDDVEHNPKFGKYCHPNCDCGRYMEIGNSVFMTYKRTSDGFEELPNKNVDFGGGLERISAAAINSPDMFKISLLWPIVEGLEEVTGKLYHDHTAPMRVIADHLRVAVFLAVDGVVPSNKEQGYVLRRLIRRAIRFAFDLGIEKDLMQLAAPIILNTYKDDFTEMVSCQDQILPILQKEERVFRQTLRKGLHQFSKLSGDGLTGDEIFMLHDTYGFPKELSLEEADKQGISVAEDWQLVFDKRMQEQKLRSQTATKGTFKGGLGGQSLQHKKYHSATHLMYQALRDVLGDHVIQRGSNITEERLRFDFSHDGKVTGEQLAKVEQIVNDQIKKDLQVTFAEYPTNEATGKLGALGQFGDRYGDVVKVYSMKDPSSKEDERPFSFEICGGPHVEHTLQLAEDNKQFKIVKEEASSAGVRRIKAVLQ